MSEPKILASIPRTSTEETRISINEYKGKSYLDMRVFYTTDEGANWLPTKKGVTFAPEKLEELKAVIEQAQEEFEQLEN